MAPVTNKGKARKYFQGLTLKTSNFAFEVILGLESAHPASFNSRDGRLNAQTAGRKKAEKEVNTCKVLGDQNFELGLNVQKGELLGFG